MTSAQHERVESVFAAALERSSPAEQAAFLDGACGSDAELRDRVEALLKADREAGSFLNSPVIDAEATLAADAHAAPPGTRIGRYKLLQLIGEGGFGTVYMAEQEDPVRRKVALKIIKAGMDTKQVIARFEAERQALALMDHPSIARVLDAGATEGGRPYVVMELVKGIPITEFCDRSRFSTAQRLQVFVQVCHAVQHAHQKGIIHRDLKPRNVLVTLHDSTPVPKVIDFGIAKAMNQRLTDKTLFTEFRQFIGTPEYMSPDQAEISGLDIDTRTDIYSLGVLLYELLTGTTPFDPQALRQATCEEIKRIIREQEPPRPSTRLDTLSHGRGGASIALVRQSEPVALRRLVRGDLDWIVMKALEKDRRRRYQTAIELAQDIERHLRHDPVLAGPPSVVYRFCKFVRRNRVAVGAGATVAVALVLGLVVATGFYFAAAHERDLARVAQARADAEAQRSERIANLLQDLFVSASPEEALRRGVDVESVLATAGAAFGEDHAAVAATLSSRALQLQSAGDLEGAERLYNESLRVWRQRYGDLNVNVAATLHSLGLLRVTKGDNPAAEQAFRECLRIGRALPGGESIAVAETLAQLANVLSNQGQFDEAVDTLRESVRIRRVLAPGQRWQIASAGDAIASALANAGRRDELKPALAEMLAAWRAALPPDSPLLARVLTRIAVYHLDRYTPEAAEPLLTEALELLQTPGNISSPQHAMTLRAMFRALEQQGRPAEIGRWALQALDVADRAGHTQAIETAELNLANHSWYVARSPRRPRADYEAALRGVEIFLARHADNVPVLNTRGVLQYRLGHYADALATLRQCDERNSQTYECGHPTDTAFIALVYARLGRPDEARTALTRLWGAMQTKEFASDEDCRNVAAEAETLLDSR